jgi:hypothetical protein
MNFVKFMTIFDIFQENLEFSRVEYRISVKHEIIPKATVNLKRTENFGYC